MSTDLTSGKGGSGSPVPHAGFSIATLITGLLAGVLVTALVVYPWQNSVVKDREQTIAAMAAAHSDIKGQVDTLSKQVRQLQGKTGELRREANRAQRHLREAQAKLAGERAAHRETKRTLDRVQGPQLADGRYLVKIKGVTLSSPPLVTVDLLTVYSGAEAQKQARNDGSWVDSTGKYVVNRGAQARTMPADPSTSVRVTYWNRQTSQTGKLIDLATLARVMTGTKHWQIADQHADYWITVRDGTISTIRARFLPPAS